jgi:hypothetical protein
MGEKKRHNFVWKIRSERDLGVTGKIILKWFLEKLGGIVCAGFIWSRIRSSSELL